MPPNIYNRGFLRNLATAMGNAGRPDLHREARADIL